MLVYLKESMAIGELEGWKIYGKYYDYGRMGPTNIPKELYYKNRDLFELAPITGEWLSKRTGKVFPIEISFVYPTMGEVEDSQWIEWSKYFDIDAETIMSDKYIAYKKRIFELKSLIVDYVEKLK